MTSSAASIAQTPRVRAMADPTFRDRMHAYAHNHRVGPLNRWIATLSGPRHGLPRIAPTYGGVEAEVLFLQQDPGTAPAVGVGYLCHQNDDPSSEQLARALDHADLPACRATAWSASPWYRAAGDGPSAADAEAGLPLLAALLDRLPRLKVVVPMGSVAQDAWRRFAQADPARARAYDCVPTPLPDEAADAELVRALVEVRGIIDAPPAPYQVVPQARPPRRICERPGTPADRSCRTA